MQLSDYRDKYHCIRFAREGGVLEMTIHTRGGPALWGVSTRSLHAELGHAFRDIAQDAENRIVIFTGTGDSFIAAGDPQEPYPEASPAEMWPRVYEEGAALLHNLLAVPVPMIAAVNGPVLLHSELPVLCDIVLAAEHAVFADRAHVQHGTVPGDGVHVVWPMLLGPNRGRYFLLTGERIGAEEAKRLGVVGEVLSAEALLPRARELAAKLAAKPALMLRHTRSVLVRELRRRMFDELAGGLAHEAMGMVCR